MPNEDIESFVRLNDENALFISDKYLTDQERQKPLLHGWNFGRKLA